MRLYIAEKPSLGRAIAEVLPKPHHQENGFIRVGNGDCVTWCIGHLLEQAEPEVYDARFKQWRMEHLPIIPQQWQLLPKSKTKQQLAVIKQLLKQADEIIHTGDPDREGQLLVDQVLAYHGVTGLQRSKVKRCLINDLNAVAVKRALTQLRANQEFATLSTSALARSRADWLYGINMTRAYTLQGQKAGYQGVLSVGRVQTPILGLVVRRDQTIEAFVSKPYYEVLALIQTPAGDKIKSEQFKAKWQPSEACEPYQDSEGRVLVKRLAENVVQRITDKPADVRTVENKNKTQVPPLPYNLSTLQIDAAKRFNMSAQQVLEHCQRLYERHKLITYPRSDCRYLPKAHFAEGPPVMAAVANNCQVLGDAITQADPQLKSLAWNDKKVEAHHAIIPTHKRLKTATLSESEQQIYELISRQYVCQFYPKHAYTDLRIELMIEGGLFVATARRTRVLGWKTLFPHAQTDNETQDIKWPKLQQGQRLHCLQGELLEKQTRPPAYFTDASLLAAMTGIARFVKDPEIRKILKETDGLGTEATRAGIIELLFTRGFLTRERKQIRATATGRALIQCLPEMATLPDMTAQWEAALDAIQSGRTQYSAFIKPLTVTLQALIEQSQTVSQEAFKGIPVGNTKSKKRSRNKSTKRPGR